MNTKVILITIDSLRANNLSINGYFRETTPNLKRILQDSINFKNAFSNGSHTVMSIPALLTSTYASKCKGVTIRPEQISIAEIARQAGYKTAYFCASPQFVEGRNYHKGFQVRNNIGNTRQESISVGSNGERQKHIFIKKWGKKLQGYIHSKGKQSTLASLFSYFYRIYDFSFNFRLSQKVRSEQIINKAIDFHKNNIKTNYFLWIHLMDTHFPLNPPKDLEKITTGKTTNIFSRAYLANIAWQKGAYGSIPSHKDYIINNHIREKIINLYDAEIRYVDRSLGKFIEHLKLTNSYDETLILITADHGEEFGEHGLFGHPSTHLYDELLHVPLILKPPRGFKTGFEDSSLVQLLDIPPTIADIMGSNLPDSFMGKSLLDERETVDAIISEGLISENNTIISARSNRYKYIYNGKKGEEIYDLITDPKEKNNLPRESVNKESFSILETKLKDHLKNITYQKIYEEIDEETKHKLQDLGYM